MGDVFREHAKFIRYPSGTVDREAQTFFMMYPGETIERGHRLFSEKRSGPRYFSGEGFSGLRTFSKGKKGEQIVF